MPPTTEPVFDVNSAYFDNHSGYEFAKQFYEDAYKAAVQVVGGEQYILSAVMHADEINRAMTEAPGREVYHYHLHVVYPQPRGSQWKFFFHPGAAAPRSQCPC